MHAPKVFVPTLTWLLSTTQTLITMDYVVHENHVLQTAWAKYKSLMPLVVATPDAYGMDEAQAQRHEHMLLNLNQTVMAGACFQFCVRQNFNVSPMEGAPRLNVSGNECVTKLCAQLLGYRRVVLSDVWAFIGGCRVFLNELCTRLTKMAESLPRAIGTPMETVEKRRLVGTFGLYVLHRRLLPNSIVRGGRS